MITPDSRSHTVTSAAVTLCDAVAVEVIMDEGPKRRALRAGAVTKATAVELADLGVDPKSNASAAAAIVLSKVMDSSPDMKEVASAARELRQAMHTVRGLAPPKDRGDKIDELAARRPRRPA